MYSRRSAERKVAISFAVWHVHELDNFDFVAVSRRLATGHHIRNQVVRLYRSTRSASSSFDMKILTNWRFHFSVGSKGTRTSAVKVGNDSHGADGSVVLAEIPRASNKNVLAE